MKNFVFISLILSVLLFSCSEEEDAAPSLDVSISGVEDASLKTGEEKSIPLEITFNNDVEGSIALSLEGVPEGVVCELSETVGTETFSTDLMIAVSDDAEAGKYEIGVTGVTSDGTDISQTFTLEVIKSLSVTFEVFNANSWSMESASYEVVEGVEIVISDGENEWTATSNAEGIAEVYNLEDGEYRFIAETETLKNLVLQEEIGGAMSGYIVLGVFESQSEIDMSPQPNASVGDLRFSDLNGDGIINSDDKTSGAWLEYEEESGELTIQVYIAEDPM